jgi:hypothetical protein
VGASFGGKIMSQKFLSFIKLLCIIYLVIFIPKIISDNSKTKKVVINDSGYLASVENLIKNKRSFFWLKKFNLALVSDIYEAKDINLLLKDGFKINKVFILNQSEKPLSKVFNQMKKINSPVFQLNLDESKFVDQFGNVDGIIFNMKNSGIKSDYCFNTLLKIMNFAQNEKKRVIILDQPNPLSRFIDGSGQIPLQHALTVAELAQYFNKYVLDTKIKLAVVPMVGWQRKNDIASVPSLYKQNILSILNEIDPINNSLDSLLIQDSILLKKGSLSNWEIDFLNKIFSKLGFNSRTYSFFDKKTNQYFKGVKIKPNNGIKNFSIFNSALTIARFFKNRKNLKLSYSDSFDKILGTQSAKEFLSNKISFEKLKNETEGSLQDFYTKSKRVLLYKPCPLITDIKLIRL